MTPYHAYTLSSAAWVIVAQIGKRSKFSSTGAWSTMPTFISRMYSAIKMSELLIYPTWMNIKCILLTEWSQTQKVTDSMIPYIQHSFFFFLAIFLSITGFEQFYNKSHWYSFLHVSCAWGLSEWWVYNFHGTWKFSDIISSHIFIFLLFSSGTPSTSVSSQEVVPQLTGLFLLWFSFSSVFHFI